MSLRPLPLPSQRHRVFSSSSLNLDAIFFWWGLKVKKKKQVLPLGLESIHRFHFLNFTEKINYFWEGSKYRKQYSCFKEEISDNWEERICLQCVFLYPRKNQTSRNICLCQKLSETRMKRNGQVSWIHHLKVKSYQLLLGWWLKRLMKYFTTTSNDWTMKLEGK